MGGVREFLPIPAWAIDLEIMEQFVVALAAECGVKPRLRRKAGSRRVNDPPQPPHAGR